MSGSLPPQAAPGGIFAGLGRLLKRPAAIRPRVPHEFSDTEFSENEFALEASEPLPQWDGVAVPLEELLDQSEARMAARQKAQDANAAATASARPPHPIPARPARLPSLQWPASQQERTRPLLTVLLKQRPPFSPCTCRLRPCAVLSSGAGAPHADPPSLPDSGRR